MKLYYMPGACSLAPHIVAKKLGLDIKLEKVNRDKTTETGANFLEISPTGAVPTLGLDNGEVLTEGAVIMQYMCDQSPKGSELLPAQGTMERVRVQEWLNYIASEIHKGVGSLFVAPRIYPEAILPQVTEALKATLPKKFDRLAAALNGRKFLTGDKMCIADIYLFVILSWTAVLKIDLAKWPKLMAFIEIMRNDADVQAAMVAEGLIGDKG